MCTMLIFRTGTVCMFEQGLSVVKKKVLQEFSAQKEISLVYTNKNSAQRPCANAK